MRAQLLTDLIEQFVSIKEDLGLPIPPICRHLQVDLTPHEGATLELVGVERGEGGGRRGVSDNFGGSGGSSSGSGTRTSCSLVDKPYRMAVVKSSSFVVFKDGAFRRCLSSGNGCDCA